MSDRESGGFGAFLLGLAVGAVAGLLFAPEAGQGTRRKLSRRLQDLRDFAEDKADDEEPEAAEAAETEDDGRAELQRRLQAARRRRKRAAAAAEGEEEDEPVA